MSKHPLSVILVAGGIGSRMMSSIPKQFLVLKGKSIVLHSFDLFLSLPNIVEIIVVCEPQYQSLFASTQTHVPVIFAQPGLRRQDSVYNGFKMISKKDSLVCVHDSARPLLTAQIVERVAEAAHEVGAAAAGMPVKPTIKICNGEQLVINTPDRATLWEVQTPQIIRYNLLKKGLNHAHKNNLTVTDDVSLIELMGHPVKMVKGAYSNLKITTPEDLILSEQMLCSNTN